MSEGLVEAVVVDVEALLRLCEATRSEVQKLIEAAKVLDAKIDQSAARVEVKVDRAVARIENKMDQTSPARRQNRTRYGPR